MNVINYRWLPFHVILLFRPVQCTLQHIIYLKRTQNLSILDIVTLKMMTKRKNCERTLQILIIKNCLNEMKNNKGNRLVTLIEIFSKYHSLNKVMLNDIVNFKNVSRLLKIYENVTNFHSITSNLRGNFSCMLYISIIYR